MKVVVECHCRYIKRNSFKYKSYSECGSVNQTPFNFQSFLRHVSCRPELVPEHDTPRHVELTINALFINYDCCKVLLSLYKRKCDSVNQTPLIFQPFLQHSVVSSFACFWANLHFCFSFIAALHTQTSRIYLVFLFYYFFYPFWLSEVFTVSHSTSSKSNLNFLIVPLCLLFSESVILEWSYSANFPTTPLLSRSPPFFFLLCPTSLSSSL